MSHLWSGHPHRLNDLEDGRADDYEDKEGLAMKSFSHERNDYKKAKSWAWWRSILVQRYFYTYNKFGADRVLVIVLAGSFHLDVCILVICILGFSLQLFRLEDDANSPKHILFCNKQLYFDA